MIYNIDSYPPNSFVVYEAGYGYEYFRLGFLDVADELTGDDKWEIVSRMKKVFEDYMKETRVNNGL